MSSGMGTAKGAFFSLADQDSCTGVKDSEIHLRFTIGDFSEKPELISYPGTPPIVDLSNIWNLDLRCFRTESRKSVIGLQFDMIRNNNQICPVELYMKLKVFSRDLQKLLEHSSIAVLTAKNCKSSFTFFVWLNSKMFLSSFGLELNAEIDMVLRDVFPSRGQGNGQHEKTLEEISRVALQTDFEYAFENRQHTDVMLKMYDGCLRAHKFVLCCRSPVFQELIQQGTHEIEVPNLSILEAEMFLKYMYTGSIGSVSLGSVVTLYEAAVQYQVLCLKNICRKNLISQITKENASEVLRLANKFNDTYLQKKYFSFFFTPFGSLGTFEEKEYLVTAIPDSLQVEMEDLAVRSDC